MGGVDVRVNAPPGYLPPVPCLEHYAGFQAFGNRIAVPQRAALYAYVAFQRLTASGGDDFTVEQTCLPGCVPPLKRRRLAQQWTLGINSSVYV